MIEKVKVRWDLTLNNHNDLEGKVGTLSLLCWYFHYVGVLEVHNHHPHLTIKEWSNCMLWTPRIP